MRENQAAAMKTRGFSLVELVVVVSIMGILFSFMIISYEVLLEQARVDMAVSNLQAIQSAQKIYWLKYKTFANQVEDLDKENLLDPAIINAINSKSSAFTYYLKKISDDTFTAFADRQNSDVWDGEATIDQNGAVSGEFKNARTGKILEAKDVVLGG